MQEYQAKSKQDIARDSYELYNGSILKLWPVSLIIAVYLQCILYLGDHGYLGQNQILTIALSYLLSSLSVFLSAIMLKMIELRSQPSCFLKALDCCTAKFMTIITVSIMIYLIAGIGFLLFFIPGIYIIVMSWFALPAIIFDGANFKQSLSISWSMVYGRWWFIFLAYLRAIFVPLLVLLSMLIVSFTIFPKSWSLFIQIIVKTLLLPYITVIVYVLYMDIRAQI